MEERFKIGYHGETRGAVDGRFAGDSVYLAHDIELARAYAEGEDAARILKVAVDAERPLIFTSSEQFRAAWIESGCDGLKAANFHPETTSHFCRWARTQGFDAIVLPEEIFEDETGFQWCVGTFGEPQTIVLDPQRVQILGAA